MKFDTKHLKANYKSITLVEAISDIVLCDCICSNWLKHQSSSSSISVYSRDMSRFETWLVGVEPNKVELLFPVDVPVEVSSELFVVDENEKFFLFYLN